MWLKYFGIGLIEIGKGAVEMVREEWKSYLTFLLIGAGIVLLVVYPMAFFFIILAFMTVFLVAMIAIGGKETYEERQAK